jgi:hypothetical protein
MAALYPAQPPEQRQADGVAEDDRWFFQGADRLQLGSRGFYLGIQEAF